VRGMIGRGTLFAVGTLLLMGMLAVLVEVQSDSGVYWTGDRVSGTSVRGLIYYRYRGADYTIPDDDRGPSDTAPVEVAVFLHPDSPTQARADNPVRWLDAFCVAIWFVVAAALVPVGILRQRRRRQRWRAFLAGSDGAPPRR